MIARSLIPAAFALLVALPAAADTIDVLRENTLKLTAADGKVTTILIKEGDKLEQVNGAGMWAAGFWQIDPRGFCWTARGESTICIKLPMDAEVGAAFDLAGPTGKVVWKGEIIAGRTDLRELSGGAPQGDH
jgi:hypothetical protein